MIASNALAASGTFLARHARAVVALAALSLLSSGAGAATVASSTAFSFTHTGSVSSGLISIGGTFNQSTVSSSPTLTLPQFNTALGRLTGVAVTVTTTTSTFAVSPSGLLSLVSGASATRTLDYTLTAGTVTGNGPNALTTSGPSLVTLLGLGSAEIGGAPLAAVRNYSLASDLAQFTGSGTISVKLTATDALAVTTLLSAFNGAGFTGSGTYAGSVGVTYTYTPAQTVGGFVYADTNHDASMNVGEAGPGQANYVKLATYSAGACQAPALLAVPADTTTGAYTLGLVDAGTYCLVLDDNATLSDIVAGRPSGTVGTEAASGIRLLTVPPTTSVAAQNFGLYAGSSISGRVFADNGAGGGTANDGVVNGSESGVANATVDVLSGATTVTTAVTDGSGNYTLWVPSSNSGTLTIAQPLPNAAIATGGSAGTTSGTYVRASNATSFTFASGQTYTGANFGTVPANTLLPDAIQTVMPGGIATFAHTFTANSAGTVTFSTSATASPSSVAFNEALIRDTNCNGVVDAGEPVITAPIAVTTGQVVCVIVKESVPAGAPLNAQNAIQISAAMSYSGASPALSTTVRRTDTAIVSMPNLLQLGKQVRNVTQATAFATANAAAPNDVIEYQVTATNPAGGAVSVIVISDGTPAYTGFVSASCPGTLPTGISACGVTTQPSVGAQGSVQWSFSGTLGSGAQVVVTYQVRVNP